MSKFLITRVLVLWLITSFVSIRGSPDENKQICEPGLNIRTITWNVKSTKPGAELSQLLGQADENRPEIYVIGLQEVKMTFFGKEPWIREFDEIFDKISCTRVKDVRLQGILLIIYSRSDYLSKFKSIESKYTPTGFGGFWGNKGGVSISLILEGISICFVNSHLAAHLEYTTKRVEDYKKIIRIQKFKDTMKSDILSHDYVIWLGDLNFRIDGMTFENIVNIVKDIQSRNSSNYSLLLEHDQLNMVRRKGLAFSEFTETEPTFAPTYKFYVNSDDYDKSRLPAFTDRILFRNNTNPDQGSGVELEIKQIEYKSISQYKQSDHKPVTGLFRIKTKDKCKPQHP